MGASQLYQQNPLNPQRRQIRLVTLNPDNGVAQIRCTLSVHSLDDQPSYAALSYCWGLLGIFKHIYTNNVAVPVRENLWWFLHHTRERNELGPFWIDAMCIDQATNSEKNHQVTMMGDIYKSARLVNVWLGKGNSSSDVAMTFIQSQEPQPIDTLHKRDKRFVAAQKFWDKQAGIRKAVIALFNREY